MTRRRAIAVAAAVVIGTGGGVAIGAAWRDSVTASATYSTATVNPVTGIASTHPSAATGQVNLTWATPPAGLTGLQLQSAPDTSGSNWTDLGAALGPTATAASDATGPYNGSRYYRVQSKAGTWSAFSAVWSSHSLPMASGTDRVSGTGTGTALTGPWTTSGTNLAALSVGDGTRYQPTAFPATPANLLGAFYLDASHGWASGSGGSISAFDGTTWTAQTSGTTMDLQQPYFVTPSVGWVVGGNGGGSGGVIRKTTDGGATWTTQTPPGGTSRLRDISCASTSHCWAVGSGGDLIATSNGGTTWSPQNSGTSANIWDVDCASSTNCVAVGRRGFTARTVDGGTNWSAQQLAGRPQLQGLSCIDTSNCWAVSSVGGVYRTTDGGVTWTAGASGTVQPLWGIEMVNATTGYLTGAGAQVRKTTDGGATWTALTVPSGIYYGISCYDASNCMTVTDLGTVLITHDGGQTWAEQVSRYVEMTPVTPTLGSGTTVTSALARVTYRTTAIPGGGTRFVLLASPDNGVNWGTFDLAVPTAANTDVSQTVDIASIGFTPASRATTIKLRFAATPQGTALTTQIDLAHVDIN